MKEHIPFFIGSFDEMYAFANYGFLQQGELIITDDNMPGQFKLLNYSHFRFA